MTDYTSLPVAHEVERALYDSHDGLDIDDLTTVTGMPTDVVAVALAELAAIEAMVTQTADGTWRHCLRRHSAAHNAVAA